MALNLGLSLYGLGHRREPGKDAALPPRPPGPLVWLQAPAAAQARGLIELARRLWAEDGVHSLITCPDPLPLPEGALQQTLPGDSVAEARAAVFDGRITDAKTITALFWAERELAGT